MGDLRETFAGKIEGRFCRFLRETCGRVLREMKVFAKTFAGIFAFNFCRSFLRETFPGNLWEI